MYPKTSDKKLRSVQTFILRSVQENGISPSLVTVLVDNAYSDIRIFSAPMVEIKLRACEGGVSGAFYKICVTVGM